MIHIARSLAALAFTALAACGGDDDDSNGGTDPGPGPAPSTAAVEAAGDANVFRPAAVTVARGGSVTWSFPGPRPHNVTFTTTGAGAGAPANIPTKPTTANPPGSESRTFATAGTFPYDCTIHPGMSGTVVVR